MKFAQAVSVAVVASVVSNAVAVAIETKGKESPPDPNKVDLPAVPAVANAGKAGYPELPAVSAMLDDATQTLTGISSRATKLQQEMLHVQQENAARMERQKAVFDRKLKEQEDKNLEVVKANALIARQIMDTKKANEELLQHAQSLQKGNSMRHSELEMLKEQLAAADKFVDDAVTETDDSKAADLEVMTQADKQDSEANQAAPADTVAQAVSLLSVAETVSTEQEPAAEQELVAEQKAEVKASAEEQPESLLTMLESGVKDMKKQGEASEAKLKDLFLTNFQAGVKRHKALLSQQQVLQTTLDSMKSYRTRIEAADKHLQDTQGKLDGRLHEGGFFLSKLSQVTMAKPEEGYKTFASLQKVKAQEVKAQ